MDEPEPSPVTVLVADDQAVFRGVLRDLILATDGFVLVGEADSGESAVEAVATLSPRMVIMDKRMPGLGGIEATRLIASRHREIVVILTSVEDPPDAAVLRSCGAAGFIRKREFSPAALVDLWRRYGG
jgi:two-component system, NarL family, invasion response regulator UvrY